MKLRLMKQLITLFSLIVCVAPKVTGQEKVNLIAGDYPPFVEVYSEQHGIISQLVELAFKQQNVQTNSEYTSWSESELKVDNNNYLSFMWSKNAERRRKWLFSEPIYTSQFVLLAQKKLKINWQYLDDLRPYKIGVIKSYNYGEQFEQYLSVLKLENSVSDYIGVKKLLDNKMDVLVIEQTVAKQLLSYFPKPKASQVELISTPSISTKASYLVCAKTYAKCFSYLDKFNQGMKQLKQLKQQGVYDKILRSVVRQE